MFRFCLSLVFIITFVYSGSLFASVTKTGDVSTIGSLYTYVGKNTTGTMTINQGSDVSGGFCYVGKESGSSGVFTVDGAGSTFTGDESTYVGLRGTGKVNVTAGGKVSFDYVGVIGYYSGASGGVTVDGANSSWSVGANCYVGFYGDGKLDITNHGSVNVVGYTAVAVDAGSSGSINFGSNGGTLTTDTFCFAESSQASQITGTGTINTKGLVSDFDLVFDAAHGSNRTYILNEPGQNVTINLSLSSDAGILGIGYHDRASMAIRDGVTVTSWAGYIGGVTDLPSEVTIEGHGSTWNNTRSFVVGGNPFYKGSYLPGGQGSLSVTDGGVVNCEYGYVGLDSDSFGVVTVDGANSKWNINSNLDVGSDGYGILNIINGGVVNSGRGHIGRWAWEENAGTGEVTVSGPGSRWNNQTLLLGVYLNFTPCSGGNATMNIIDGGLVCVADKLYIDTFENNQFINMTGGGMLAIAGDADDSLTDFFGLIEGGNTIRWWDDSIGTDGDWAMLTTATCGKDYTLEYITEGDLAGYTLLTVATVPEPGTIASIRTLLCAVGAGFAVRKRG